MTFLEALKFQILQNRRVDFVVTVRVRDPDSNSRATRHHSVSMNAEQLIALDADDVDVALAQLVLAPTGDDK